MMNTLKVGLLLTALTALFVVAGRFIGGTNGMLIAFGLAVLMNVGSYWFSDKIVLGMYGAQPVAPGEAPQLYSMLERLAQRGGIPVPRLYIIPDPQPNAFATGRNPRHAAVAVNQGLLDLLSPDEVEGVVAHELSHIRHRDTLTMTIVATLAGAIMVLADIARWGMIFGGGGRDDDEGANPLVLLVMIIVAPLAAMLIQFAVSRAREFEADAGAAQLTGSPRGLMNALQKLEQGTRMIPSNGSPQTAHMFIVNPLSGAGEAIFSLFRTHPPTAQRVERLRQWEVQHGIHGTGQAAWS